MRRQCDVPDGNRSGLYYEPLGESQENLKLMRLRDERYTRAPFYGSRKMVEWLATKGFDVNRKRVSRLMALMGIEAVGGDGLVQALRSELELVCDQGDRFLHRGP